MATTWYAVYDASSGTLVSSGSGGTPPIVRPPLVAVVTSYSDPAIPEGSQPNFTRDSWNESTHQFDPAPARVKSVDQIAAETLIAKPSATWTTADVATALRILLSRITF